jgi:hypothetical protein
MAAAQKVKTQKVMHAKHRSQIEERPHSLRQEWKKGA